jgi:hypothetical protein
VRDRVGLSLPRGLHAAALPSPPPVKWLVLAVLCLIAVVAIAYSVPIWWRLYVFFYRRRR